MAEEPMLEAKGIVKYLGEGLAGCRRSRASTST